MPPTLAGRGAEQRGGKRMEEEEARRFTGAESFVSQRPGRSRSRRRGSSCPLVRALGRRSGRRGKKRDQINRREPSLFLEADKGLRYSDPTIFSLSPVRAALKARSFFIRLLVCLLVRVSASVDVGVSEL